LIRINSAIPVALSWQKEFEAVLLVEAIFEGIPSKHSTSVPWENVIILYRIYTDVLHLW
jgi:hypothetical protein